MRYAREEEGRLNRHKEDDRVFRSDQSAVSQSTDADRTDNQKQRRNGNNGHGQGPTRGFPRFSSPWNWDQPPMNYRQGGPLRLGFPPPGAGIPPAPNYGPRFSNYQRGRGSNLSGSGQQGRGQGNPNGQSPRPQGDARPEESNASQ